MIEYYFSSPHYTCLVQVRDGRVVGGAPIIMWSRGKSWDWLVAYAVRRWGEAFRYEELQTRGGAPSKGHRGNRSCSR